MCTYEGTPYNSTAILGFERDLPGPERQRAPRTVNHVSLPICEPLEKHLKVDLLICLSCLSYDFN